MTIFDFLPFWPLQLEQNASFDDVVLAQLGVLLELRRRTSVKSEGGEYGNAGKTWGKRRVSNSLSCFLGVEYLINDPGPKGLSRTAALQLNGGPAFGG